MGEIKKFPGNFENPAPGPSPEDGNEAPEKRADVLEFKPRAARPGPEAQPADARRDAAELDRLLERAGELLGAREKFPSLDFDHYLKLRRSLPFLTRQEGVGRSARLAQSYDMVKGYSDEELAGWVNEHDEGDWRQRPAWYKAIADEIARRLRDGS